MPPPSTHPTLTRPQANPPNRPKAPGASPPHPQVSPPSDGERLSLPGASDRQPQRRTAQHRVMITPHVEPGRGNGFAMTDLYVRRFWVAAIGPGAVADLLRLAAAAKSGRSLPIPVHLPILLHERLVRCEDGALIVPDQVPPLPSSLADRLTPSLRRQFISERRKRLAV